jgi:hypothetical protein
MERVNIDYNDTRALLETGNYDLECRIKPIYLNYLKMLMYKNAKVDNYVRPVKDIDLTGYAGLNSEIKDTIQLNKGEYIILLYPDVITTPEINNFYKSEAQVGYAYIYDKNENRVTTKFRKPIDEKDIEVYRCISSFISFNQEVNTKSAFIKAPFMPIITDETENKGDIRFIDFFQDIANLNIPFKEINKTKDLRYVTPLNSLDIVAKIDNQPIMFLNPFSEGSKIEHLTEAVFTNKTEEEIINEYSITPRLFKYYLSAIETSKIKGYSVMPKVPCMVLDIKVEKQIQLEVVTRLELFYYTYDIKTIIQPQYFEANLIEDCTKLMKAGYFMNAEELIRLLIVNNNYTMNILDEKDRNLIKNIRQNKARRDAILAIFSLLWQYFKEETKLD